MSLVVSAAIAAAVATAIAAAVVSEARVEEAAGAGHAVEARRAAAGAHVLRDPVHHRLTRRVVVGSDDVPSSKRTTQHQGRQYGSGIIRLDHNRIVSMESWQHTNFNTINYYMY